MLAMITIKVQLVIRTHYERRHPLRLTEKHYASEMHFSKKIKKTNTINLIKKIIHYQQLMINKIFYA